MRQNPNDSYNPSWSRTTFTVIGTSNLDAIEKASRRLESEMMALRHKGQIAKIVVTVQYEGADYC